jgi:hypothetical protein
MNLDEAQIATLRDDAFLGGDCPAEEPGQFEGPYCPFVVVAHHRGRALKLDAARWESRNQAVVDGHDERHVGMFLDISYLASGCPVTCGRPWRITVGSVPNR